MKMLDYVELANSRLGENLTRGAELVRPLVDLFVAERCARVISCRMCSACRWSL